MTTHDNPFAPQNLERLAFRFPGGVTWEQLLARLEANQFCASIVGPTGSGKTVLLRQLAPRLEAMGFAPRFFQLTAESRLAEKEEMVEEVRGMRKPEIILLDGAERLTTRQWLPLRAAASQAAGFVVTLFRVGRLQTVLECETTPALLEDLVQELSGARLPKGEAAGLMSRHRGNIRDAMRELHDRWAGGAS